MILKLLLENFRCFEEHEVSFKERSILVGRNNAGKSTIIEALRLISVVVSRYKNLKYESPPGWVPGMSHRIKGVRPSIKNIIGNFETICHQYRRDSPAVITATLTKGFQIKIYLSSEGEIFSYLIEPEGHVVTSRAEANQLDFPEVKILPPIGPVNKEENILRESYVQSAAMLATSSLHFRNQLVIENALFDSFRSLAENTWPGLVIDSLTQDHENDLTILMVRDRGFVAEIGTMGHGLQMWLQVIWFLTRSREAETIILDEPDVYLHADLQRKLFKLLKKYKKQIILATHSVEIISEAEPDEILVIDRSKKKSNYTTSLPGVQSIISHIGSAQNLQLMRLWSSKRCIFVEGEDLKILRHFHQTLFPDAEEPLSVIPFVSVEGRNNWRDALSTTKILINNQSENIASYCILDSDYYTPESIASLTKEASDNNLQLHVWRRKEIENYLLIPSVIARLITVQGPYSITTEMVEAEIDNFAESIKNNITDLFASEFQKQNRGQSIVTINPKARAHVDEMWKERDTRWGIIPGKQALSHIIKWAQSNFHVSFSPSKVAIGAKANEIPEEVIHVITSIEKIRPFNRRTG